MTYRDLLKTLTTLAKVSPDKLDDSVFVIGSSDTPEPIVNAEFNDGSVSGVSKYQLLLVTV